MIENAVGAEGRAAGGRSEALFRYAGPALQEGVDAEASGMMEEARKRLAEGARRLGMRVVGG